MGIMPTEAAVRDALAIATPACSPLSTEGVDARFASQLICRTTRLRGDLSAQLEEREACPGDPYTHDGASHCGLVGHCASKLSRIRCPVPRQLLHGVGHQIHRRRLNLHGRYWRVERCLSGRCCQAPRQQCGLSGRCLHGCQQPRRRWYSAARHGRWGGLGDRSR